MTSPTLQQKKDAINGFATFMPLIDSTLKKVNNAYKGSEAYDIYVKLLNNNPDPTFQKAMYLISSGITQEQYDQLYKGLKNVNQNSNKAEIQKFLKTMYSNCQIVLKQLAMEVKASSKHKNSIGSGGLPESVADWSHASGILDNSLDYSCASGLPTQSSGWFPASGETHREIIIEGHKPMRNASGVSPRENIINRNHFRNASGGGVGAITWNTSEGAYEDTNGIKYFINDDGKTFDDGSGNTFNQDGTIGTKGGILTYIVDIFNSPTVKTTAIELAKEKINADTKLSADQKAAQIATVNAGAKKANSWVLPVTLVGGVIAVGVAYKYFIAKKK